MVYTCPLRHFRIVDTNPAADEEQDDEVDDDDMIDDEDLYYDQDLPSESPLEKHFAHSDSDSNY
jgi:hypothetical protein